MANTQAPFGFRPVSDRTGASWDGTCQSVIIKAADTNAVFNGTMLKATSEQIFRNGIAYQVATAATTADTNLIGACVGVQTQDVPSLQYYGYRPAGAQADDVVVQVPQDRDVMYAVQEDSVGGAIALNSVNKNVDFTAETGVVATRSSTQALDSDTVNTTNTLPLRIVRLERSPNNEQGNYAQWIVTINLDMYSNTTGI